MQYAKVLVNTKSDELQKEYTYKIPPELLVNIKRGVVVEVSFGRSKKLGLVSRITRFVNSNIKYKLKNIDKIVYKNVVFSDTDFSIARQISNYYLINMGQLVFFMIEKISRKSEISERKISAEKKQHSQTIYIIEDKKEKRICHYKKLIEKANNNKLSTLILFPDFDANLENIKKLEEFAHNTIIERPKLDIKQKTKNYNKINSNEIINIIGTRNTIFKYPNNLGLIIIDEPNHFGYKEEQTTHHNTKKIAQVLSMATGSKLIFGDNFIYEKNLKTKSLLRKYPNFKTKINLVDTKNDYEFYNLNNILKNNIEKNILIIANDKHESSGLICSECENIFRCNRCDAVKKIDNNEFICSVCGEKTQIPTKCPECKSVNLRKFGLTRNKVKQIIKDSGIQGANIKIETKYFLEKNLEKFDLILILDFENLFFDSGFNAGNKIISKIFQLTSTCKKFYLFHKDAENNLVNTLANLDLRKIIKNDLFNSNELHYPPFYKLIKFYLKDKNYNLCQKNISKLKKNIENLNLKNAKLEISDTIYTGKKRDKHYWQIILKIPEKNYLYFNKVLLKNYSRFELSKYLIDVEPIKLLQ